MSFICQTQVSENLSNLWQFKGKFSATELTVFRRFVSVTSPRPKRHFFACVEGDRLRNPGRIGGGRCTGGGRRGGGGKREKKRKPRNIVQYFAIEKISAKRREETKIAREPGLKGNGSGSKEFETRQTNTVTVHSKIRGQLHPSDVIEL